MISAGRFADLVQKRVVFLRETFDLPAQLIHHILRSLPRILVHRIIICVFVALAVVLVHSSLRILQIFLCFFKLLLQPHKLQQVFVDLILPAVDGFLCLVCPFLERITFAAVDYTRISSAHHLAVISLRRLQAQLLLPCPEQFTLPVRLKYFSLQCAPGALRAVGCNAKERGALLYLLPGADKHLVHLQRRCWLIRLRVRAQVTFIQSAFIQIKYLTCHADRQGRRPCDPRCQCAVFCCDVMICHVVGICDPCPVFDDTEQHRGHGDPYPGSDRGCHDKL